MIFHILGIPHTITNKEYCCCAYTQKVWKLCHMLFKMGHTVYHYGVEGSCPPCTESISVVRRSTHDKTYPENWERSFFSCDTKTESYQEFNLNAPNEIRKRLGGRDFLLCAFGWGHKEVADILGDVVMTVESGIGYNDYFSNFRVFESYCWMHTQYAKFKQEQGSFYDAVIPNYFDPDDFEYNEDKEDWFLYLGRLIPTKGLDVILEIAKTLNIHIKVAGQGILDDKYIECKNIEFVGFADIHKRKFLMSKAKALLAPTIYIEPFGGVTIEAMMSGTPVISTDWGVFNETVLHNVTGFRCRTLDHFCWAVNNIGLINPQDCRNWALHNFSIDRISSMYQEYFEMLNTIWGKGWYELNDNRQNLDWLNKQYP